MLTVVIDILVVEMWIGRVHSVQGQCETGFRPSHGLHGDLVHSQVHDGRQDEALFGLRHPDHLFHPGKRELRLNTCTTSKNSKSLFQ